MIMAGIGKLAKLAKTLWKGVSYLPRKAHQLQTPFIAPTGGKLSTGKKIANCIFKTTDYAGILCLLGAGGAMSYELYQTYKNYNADNIADANEHFLKLSKYTDTALGLIGGFLLGGPIGSLALGAAAYFAEKDLFFGSISSEEQAYAIKELRELKEQENQEEAVDPEDSTEVAPTDSTATAPTAPIAPADSTATAPTAPIAPADSTATAPTAPIAPADSTATAPTAPTAPVDSTETEPTAPATQPQQPQAPRNNLFGGTINEISIKKYDVKPKDCLWNIARRELEKANPGVIITNGQVLIQVKEFIRLNPQIKNPDLIYPNQKIKTAA